MKEIELYELIREQIDEDLKNENCYEWFEEEC